jgi:ferric-dicitrate binding protein FerR (iron transport regulator)
MTTRREQVKRALWQLEREPMPIREPADEAARRNRIASAVNTRVRELSKEKSRSFRTRAVLLASAAAAVAFVFGAVWFRGGMKASSHDGESPVAALRVDGPVSVVHDGQNRPVDDAAPPRLSSADTLRTATGASAHAVLASGTVVNVQASTSIRFRASRTGTDGAEDMSLDSGTIALKVPKLGPHRRLSIHTPDAVVTVRGTEFSVEVRERDGHTITGVKVVEGSVWVASKGRELTLEKGSEWSSEAEPTVARVEPEPAAALDAAGASAVPAPAASHGSSTSRDEPASTLGAENDQYQRGVSAARLGDDRKALGAFETFLQRYPASPLAQSAEVERFRALKRIGRVDEAARRARQYLASYPGGFARAEAQTLSSPSAPTPERP